MQEGILMSALTNEWISKGFNQPPLSVVEDLNVPHVIVVSELPSDELAQKRAQRLCKKAGELAIAATDIEDHADGQYNNLHEAILGAIRGEQAGIAMLTMNVGKDLFERIAKAGFVMESRSKTDENGEIVQHGQTDENIQLNTLRYLGKNEKMFPRLMGEVRNKYRVGDALRAGHLKDYWFVVLSRCADDMTNNELEDNGFFTLTQSMAVQATTQQGEDIVIQSAFVAGVKDEDSPRHDYETVKQFGEKLGVDLTGTAAETIDTPLLIPKILMPNGVVDLVKLLDEAAGGLFFGQDVPAQDYIDFLADCKTREVEMQPTIEKIVHEIISLADTITNPLEASELLGTVVGKYMVKASVTDERIDPRVFGTESAFLITYARVQIAVGNYGEAHQATNLAVIADKSSSCPGGVKRDQGVDGGIPDMLEAANDLSSTRTEKIADCDFVSKECPMCHAKNVKTTSKGGVFYGACGCDSVHGKKISTPETKPKDEKQRADYVAQMIRLLRKSSTKPTPNAGKEPLAKAA